MRRFLPYLIICFAILGFSKLMSILNSEGVFEALNSHAENSSENVEAQRPPAEVKIKDQYGKISGTIYNIDTSQIQKINTCGQLYDLKFSPEEVQILQSLRLRSAKLDDIEKDISLKQEMLVSIQNDINRKLEQLEKLNSQMTDDPITSSSQNYEKLVKIYEGMKPKEAAKIFDTLQIQVLLRVAQQMKENRLAAVVAEMMPEKARDLTMSLANRSE